MTNPIYTAQGMRDEAQRRYIQKPISAFWEEVNKSLEQYYGDFTTDCFLIDIVTVGQLIYDKKELSDAVTELKKAGFQVSNLEVCLHIRW